jgi:single-strand selective monofunctional uracil DNA glycosylase
LRREADALAFGAPVTHVYDPLGYAWGPHREYLERFGAGAREVLLVGMNPGPFGMAQTGVPFGDKDLVRDWMGLAGEVGHPDPEHPKRPIQGFACPRGEVSGQRLWGWARARFGPAEAFFARFFVANYCPLVFMEASGRNRTPDKLAKAEREALFAVCDRALVATIDRLQPRWVLGIGRFAEARIRAVVGERAVTVGAVPHPSPASPKANQGWAPLMDAALDGLGIGLPG